MNSGKFLIYSIFTTLIITFILYIINSRKEEKNFEKTRMIYYLSTVMYVFAIIFLLAAFLNNEFQYMYVYSNSSLDLPLAYKISGIWTGKSGSFLLWALMLNVIGLFVIKNRDEDESVVISVLILTQLFILFLLMIDSPFEYVWNLMKDVKPGQVIPDGSGLNPLLIDPWMVVHPPVLFLGFATATIPFAYGLAALIKNKYDQWIDRSYVWIIISMVTLGIGIFLGGYWSYKVLGWGGYWAWDPVENSSLIPWIVVVALLHGIILQKRKNALIKTNLFLTAIYFTLVFYSTFLTRSGVLADFSVHSFGASSSFPQIKEVFSLVAGGSIGSIGTLFYLILTSINILLPMFFIGSLIFFLVLFIKRFKSITGETLNSKIFNWDTLTGFGIISLVIYSFIILIGTSWPIITGIFAKNPTNVSINFYNNLSIPFGLLFLGFMVLSTISILKNKIKNNLIYINIAVSIVISVLANIFFTSNLLPYVFTAASLFVIFQYAYDLIIIKSKEILPSRLSHLGLAIMILGVVVSAYHSTNEQKRISKNIESKFGNMGITFKGFTNVKNSQIIFDINESGKTFEIKTDFYFSEKMNSIYREPYILNGFFNDVYIIPDEYSSGAQSSSMVTLNKDQKVNFSGMDIIFKKFSIKGMKGSDPQIFVNLLVNGKKMSPSLKMVNGKWTEVNEKIFKTDRLVVLKGFDISKKSIALYISPDKNTIVMPDTVMVQVAKKRLIWLVWLGTILIALGGSLKIYFLIRKKAAKA